MEWERNVPLWQCPTQLGKSGAHWHASLSPVGEINGQEHLTRYWAVLPCGRGNVGKIKLFLFSSPMCPDLYFLSPVVCWNFSTGDLDFHKGLFVCGWLSFFFINLFIYLFLAVLGLRFCARASSSCGERGPLFIAVHGPLTVAAPPRPPRCRAQAPDAQAQQLWLTGPVAPQHVGFSQTRARTRVPCIGRQTPNHCTTGEAQGDCLKTLFSRVSHTVAERGWSRFTGHCRVSSQDWGLHAYYLMHGWVRLLLGLLAHGAGSHRCYKALLSVDGCQIVVECRDMWGLSYSAMLLTSPTWKILILYPEYPTDRWYSSPPLLVHPFMDGNDLGKSEDGSIPGAIWSGKDGRKVWITLNGRKGILQDCTAFYQESGKRRK